MGRTIARIALTALFITLIVLSSKTLADALSTNTNTNNDTTIFLPIVSTHRQPRISNHEVLAHLIAGTSQLHSHAILYLELLDYNEFESLRLLGHDLAYHASELVFSNLHAAGDERRAAQYHATFLLYSTHVCYDGDKYNDWATWLPQHPDYQQQLLAYADVLLSACTQ